MSEFSQSRLESRILEAVSRLIVSGAIKNHNLSTLTSVTRVVLSPDNSQAKIYLSNLSDNSTLDKSVQALNGASAFIQGRIAQLLKTKNTPKLYFYKDNSYIEGDRINTLIDEVVKNGK